MHLSMSHAHATEQLAVLLDLQRPLHDRIEAAATLLDAVDAAITAEKPVEGLAPEHLAPAFAAPDIDRVYRSGQRCVSLRMLVFCLQMRIDIMLNEASWRPQSQQRTLADAVKDEAHRAFFEDHWTDEPILFWSQSQIMAVLAVVQMHWRDASAPDFAPLLALMRQRFALLLTFEFDDCTLDMKKYRCLARSGKQRKTYCANTHFLFDVAAVLMSMDRELHADRSDVVPFDVEPYDTGKLEALVKRVLWKMHGDALPQWYADVFTADHVRVGQAAAFARNERRGTDDGGVASQTNLAVIRWSCGGEFARKVQIASQRPLREVYAEAPLQPSLVMATCAYYASQRGYADPREGIVWVPVVNRYAVKLDGRRVLCPSYPQALLHFVTCKWPEGAFSFFEWAQHASSPARV